MSIARYRQRLSSALSAKIVQTLLQCFNVQIVQIVLNLKAALIAHIAMVVIVVNSVMIVLNLNIFMHANIVLTVHYAMNVKIVQSVVSVVTVSIAMAAIIKQENSI